MIALHLLDPDEMDLPFEGPNWFEDMEPGAGAADPKRRLLADAADVRRAYQEELGNYLGELRRGLVENDIEYHLTRTSDPPEKVLLSLLRGPLRNRGRR